VLDQLRGEVQAGLDDNYAQIGVERARDLWQMTLDYGQTIHAAELAWLEQAIEKARRLPPLTPPGQWNPDQAA